MHRRSNAAGIFATGCLTLQTPQAAPAPAHERRRARRAPRRAIRFFVILVGAVFVGNAIVGERGLVSMLRAAGELEELSRLTAELRARNDQLRDYARRLREDPRTIEQLARGELGLMRPDETLFIIIDRSVPAAGDATAPDPPAPQPQAP